MFFFSIFIKDERIGSGTGKRSGAFLPTENVIPEKDCDENRQKTTTTKKTSGKGVQRKGKFVKLNS